MNFGETQTFSPLHTLMENFTWLGIEDIHVNKPAWKQFLQLQSSLQMTAAQVNTLNAPHVRP